MNPKKKKTFLQQAYATTMNLMTLSLQSLKNAALYAMIPARRMNIGTGVLRAKDGVMHFVPDGTPRKAMFATFATSKLLKAELAIVFSFDNFFNMGIFVIYLKQLLFCV